MAIRWRSLGSADGEVIVFDLDFANATTVTSLELLRFDEHEDDVFAVAISADGETALSGGGGFDETGGDTRALLWDTQTGIVRQTFNDSQAPIWSVAQSPDGKLAAAGNIDGKVMIWTIDDGSLLMELESPRRSPVTGLAFSPDGEVLYISSGDPFDYIIHGGLMAIDIDTGEERWKVDSGTEILDRGLLGMGLSADGSVIAAGITESQDVQLYNAEDGELIWHTSVVLPPGDQGSFEGFAFSPDGQTLLAGSINSSTIFVLDANTGEQIGRLRGHSGPLHQIAYTPDGERVVSASGLAIRESGTPNEVIVWDVASGDPLLVFDDHQNWVRGVAVSPDGHRALTSSGDGTVRVWPISIDGILGLDRTQPHRQHVDSRGL